MKAEYIINELECANKGLTLNDYALTSEFIPALITRALDIATTRCCTLNDNFDKGAKSVEQALDQDVANGNDMGLVESFKKLQFQVLYNLIFTATDDPVDQYIDSIIVFELHWGKINGIQKGLFYKNN